MTGGERSSFPAPPLTAAYYGLAGDFVRAIEPHTEADPVAILVSLFVGFGNLIGRNRYWIVEVTRHYPNLFMVLVGDTSTGRKGTAWDHARRLLAEVDPVWARECTASGLSSGEGLIWNVRDPTIARKKQRKQGNDGHSDDSDDGGVAVLDPGVEDKRLQVVESEFASVLKQATRESNILSPILRQAWDSGDLRSLVKTSPARATGAHVSILGHITEDELLRTMVASEYFSGFANRFGWLKVHRSKFLPDGGRLHDVDLSRIVRRLAEAVAFGKRPGQMVRDDAADELWHGVFNLLTTGKPGLLGAVTARAAPQVMRLALIYAVLDCSPVIRHEHLFAALALWEYSERCCATIWRSTLGNRTADKILAELRQMSPAGLSRTGISALLGRNEPQEAIEHALSLLAKRKLAEMRKVPPAGGKGGRPTETWFANDDGDGGVGASELGFFLLSYDTKEPRRNDEETPGISPQPATKETKETKEPPDSRGGRGTTGGQHEIDERTNELDGDDEFFRDEGEFFRDPDSQGWEAG